MKLYVVTETRGGVVIYQYVTDSAILASQAFENIKALDPHLVEFDQKTGAIRQADVPYQDGKHGLELRSHDIRIGMIG